MSTEPVPKTGLPHLQTVSATEQSAGTVYREGHAVAERQVTLRSLTLAMEDLNPLVSETIQQHYVFATQPRFLSSVQLLVNKELFHQSSLYFINIISSVQLLFKQPYLHFFGGGKCPGVF